MSEKLSAWLYSNLKLVLAGVAVLTGFLLLPFLLMAPTVSASTEPEGDVFTARDRIDETFVPSVHPTFLIAEYEGGNVLTSDALTSLLEAEDRLRSDPDLSPNLVQYFDPESQTEINGVVSLADLIETQLASQGIEVSDASDGQLADVAQQIIDRFGERSELLGLSAESTQQPDGTWTVPALTFIVLSDNEVLGFGNTSVNLGGDTAVEEYDREIQEVFRGSPGWRVNGVAIDVNLTSQEQGAIAGPFIGFTILAVLILVGLTFRSYWVLATVSVLFLVLIVWLKGISNLIGLKDDLVLSLIVPVAMISFGVDFAFHSIGRYREERAAGWHSATAVVKGLAAVSGALILAFVSDTMAFLANLSSDIESIQQFGIGAAIALASAYLLLGVLAPLIVASIESQVPQRKPGTKWTILRLSGGVFAALATMASVLLLVFVLPWLGAVLAVATVCGVVIIPVLVQRRKVGTTVANIAIEEGETTFAKPIGRAIAAVAGRPFVVLPIATALTVVCAFYALQVPAEFDVEDFFSSDTDFVQGLEQLDTHVGDRGGEPALIYIEGDVSSPENLSLLQSRIEEIKELDTETLARDADGVIVREGIFTVLDAIWESEPMMQLVLDESGVALTDDNGDGIPDTSEQVDAALLVASNFGVPFDANRLVLTPDDVNTVVSLRTDPDLPDVTVFEMNVVDSRSQTSVAESRDLLEPIAASISDDLDGSFVQVTGSAFVRDASLEGTNQALSVSLPIALVLCLFVSTFFLRSLRYGMASVVPILMVVAWLYAFMYVAGFAINLVTATIAAVSIGIGIDFAIHFIARYREELDRHKVRSKAVRITGESTGLALVASAISSAVGFGILAFAPMPLFAAYGLLTMLMILMALTATLVVLPSLLTAITSDVESELTREDEVSGRSPKAEVDVVVA